MIRNATDHRYDAQHILQLISINVVVIVSLYFVVDVAQNMMPILRWEFPSSNRMPKLSIYIFFLILQTLTDVATIIYQYGDGPSNEKIQIRHLGNKCANS